MISILIVLDKKRTRNLRQYLDHYRDLPFERVAESFRREEILSVIRGLQTKRLGEIGCGLDSVFNYLDASIGGFIVEPISELLAQQANLRNNVETFCTTLEKLDDYKIENADTILLSSVLHEVEDARLFALRALDVLEIGGNIICVVSNGHSLHRYVGWQKGILSEITGRSDTQDLMQQKQEIFTADSLTKFFTDLNVQVIQCYSFMPKLLSHGQMQELLDNNQIDENFLRIMNDLSPMLQPVGSELLLVGRKNGHHS